MNHLSQNCPTFGVDSSVLADDWPVHQNKSSWVAQMRYCNSPTNLGWEKQSGWLGGGWRRHYVRHLQRTHYAGQPRGGHLLWMRALCPSQGLGGSPCATVQLERSLDTIQPHPACMIHIFHKGYNFSREVEQRVPPDSLFFSPFSLDYLDILDILNIKERYQSPNSNHYSNNVWIQRFSGHIETTFSPPVVRFVSWIASNSPSDWNNTIFNA